MALSTKDLQGGASSVKKTIAPGNHRLKINSVNLETFKFIENAYHLVLNVETEPLKDFEGFLIDSDNPDSGRYNGQVGKVTASRYAFADGETKSGIKVERDRSILVFLKTLSKNLDFANDSETFTKWFTDQDGEHETIEEFVEAFDKVINKEEKVYLDFCIGGREWENKNGYINYNLFLVKPQKGKYSITTPDSKALVKFDSDDSQHLIRLVVKNVESFGDDDISIPSNTSNDFSLD
tara:strand:- start:74 stop:784 length:711 start_codon:yes stop_codon:yes gene_type:complete